MLYAQYLVLNIAFLYSHLVFFIEKLYLCVRFNTNEDEKNNLIYGFSVVCFCMGR